MPSDRPRGFDAGSRVAGELVPPGSKSIAQRALVLAALAEGTTEVAGLPAADDVEACLALVEACGAGLERPGAGRVRVAGRPPGAQGGGLAPRAPVSAGESGTLGRFAAACLGLAGEPGREVLLEARGSLRGRRSAPLFAALRGAGVGVAHPEADGADGWPVALRPARPRAALELVAPVSSQELSALWLASAALPEGPAVEVEGDVPSAPYLRLTLDALARFGVRLREHGTGPRRTWSSAGRLVAPSGRFHVEPDASAAAVGLAAGCLSGGEVRVPGLTPASSQGDVRVLEHLARLGCETRGDAGGLVASGRPDRGARLDLSGEPDLAPVLAAVAAGAARWGGARTELVGLGTLPGKESDRIAVLAGGLRALGFAVAAGREALAVAPPERAPAEGLVLDPAGDHRMAFAFALLGWVVPGTRVAAPGCVAKSWPSFWGDVEALLS